MRCQVALHQEMPGLPSSSSRVNGLMISGCNSMNPTQTGSTRGMVQSSPPRRPRAKPNCKRSAFPKLNPGSARNSAAPRLFGVVQLLKIKVTVGRVKLATCQKHLFFESGMRSQMRRSASVGLWI